MFAAPRPVLVLACLGLGGCFNPDDLFPLRGSLSSPDALEGQRVELLRERRTAVYGPCVALQPFLETTADAEGRYGFELFRAQTQSLLGSRGTYCFRAQAMFASGASAALDVPEVVGELTLPTFPDWHANFSRDTRLFSFAPAQALPPEQSPVLLVHRLEVHTLDGGLAWRADDVVLDPDTGAPLRVELRADRLALEEFTGRASLQARWLPPEALTVDSFAEALPLAMRLNAPETVELQTTVLPWSWKAGCSAVAEPCPLTDHLLEPVELGGVEPVRVDFLGSVVPVAIVLRGYVSAATSLTITLIDENRYRHTFEHQLRSSLWANGLELVTTTLADGGHVSTVQPEPRFTVIPLFVSYAVETVIITFPGGVERMSELSIY